MITKKTFINIWIFYCASLAGCGMTTGPRYSEFEFMNRTSEEIFVDDVFPLTHSPPCGNLPPRKVQKDTPQAAANMAAQELPAHLTIRWWKGNSSEKYSEVFETKLSIPESARKTRNPKIRFLYTEKGWSVSDQHGK